MSTSVLPRSVRVLLTVTRTPAAIKLPAMEAMEPSQVLPGLRRGASLCLPKARPIEWAAMSPDQTQTMRKQQGGPCSCFQRSGMSVSG